MLHPGQSRHRLAGTLKAAYGDGLLSEATRVHRLELLFGRRIVDPTRVIGDLTLRAPRRSLSDTLARALETARGLLDVGEPEPGRLLALDWDGTQEELLLGRDPACTSATSGCSSTDRGQRGSSTTSGISRWVRCW
ncbi:MAG: hypothetical protein M3016_01960 [Actinomycetota bacterium]|nr:hypothetical protein [Actinomycetota bacterium]